MVMPMLMDTYYNGCLYMVVRFIHSGCLPKGLDNITHLHDLCYSKINTDVDFMVTLINQQFDLT